MSEGKYGYGYKCEFISNNEAEIAPKKCVIEESVVVTTLSWEYVVATSVSLFQRQILETLSLDMTNVRFSRKCLCNVTFSNNTFFRRDLWTSTNNLFHHFRIFRIAFPTTLHLYLTPPWYDIKLAALCVRLMRCCYGNIGGIITDRSGERCWNFRTTHPFLMSTGVG